MLKKPTFIAISGLSFSSSLKFGSFSCSNRNPSSFHSFFSKFNEFGNISFFQNVGSARNFTQSLVLNYTLKPKKKFSHPDRKKEYFDNVAKSKEFLKKRKLDPNFQSPFSRVNPGPLSPEFSSEKLNPVSRQLYDTYGWRKSGYANFSKGLPPTNRLRLVDKPPPEVLQDEEEIPSTESIFNPDVAAPPLKPKKKSGVNQMNQEYEPPLPPYVPSEKHLNQEPQIPLTARQKMIAKFKERRKKRQAQVGPTFLGARRIFGKDRKTFKVESQDK